MRQRMIALLMAAVLACLLVMPAAAMAQAVPMDASAVQARGAILVDAASGEVLFEKQADNRVPIASVTKIMTLILAMEALDEGRLTKDQMIMVSQRAAGMGGSQAFLDAGSSYDVDTLIKSIIIGSANDSSVAIGEAIAGSFEVFVSRMNERAKELGMENTLFSNPTGLPGGDHYSTARDVAKMGAELLTHPTFFEYSKIWLDTLVHPGGRETTLSNTNRLTRMMDGADGIKTGFTNEAMHCLAATAKRGDMRLIAVVLGAPSSAIRFDNARSMLEYGFANFESRVILQEGQTLATVPVARGKAQQVDAVAASNVSMTVEKGAQVDYEIRSTLPEVLVAPVEQGQAIGTASVYVQDSLIAEIALITGQAVERATFWDTLISIIGKWK